MNKLQKAREYKKRRILEETEIERKIRLKKKAMHIRSKDFPMEVKVKDRSG